MQNVLNKFGRKFILGVMLKLASLDAPGVLHHVMGRGIEDSRCSGPAGFFTGSGQIVGICRT